MEFYSVVRYRILFVMYFSQNTIFLNFYGGLLPIARIPLEQSFRWIYSSRSSHTLHDICFNHLSLSKNILLIILWDCVRIIKYRGGTHNCEMISRCGYSTSNGAHICSPIGVPFSFSISQIEFSKSTSLSTSCIFTCWPIKGLLLIFGTGPFNWMTLVLINY